VAVELEVASGTLSAMASGELIELVEAINSKDGNANAMR
jgi:hypothetical protein